MLVQLLNLPKLGIASYDNAAVILPGEGGFDIRDAGKVDFLSSIPLHRQAATAFVRDPVWQYSIIRAIVGQINLWEGKK